MKPPHGAMTTLAEMRKLLAKAKTKPVKVFLVWRTSQPILTTVELTPNSYIDDRAMYNVKDDYEANHFYQEPAVKKLKSSTVSLMPILNKEGISLYYWYFRNYWHAYGYLLRMKAQEQQAA